MYRYITRDNYYYMDKDSVVLGHNRKASQKKKKSKRFSIFVTSGGPRECVQACVILNPCDLDTSGM